MTTPILEISQVRYNKFNEPSSLRHFPSGIQTVTVQPRTQRPPRPMSCCRAFSAPRRGAQPWGSSSRHLQGSERDTSAAKNARGNPWKGPSMGHLARRLFLRISTCWVTLIIAKRKKAGILNQNERLSCRMSCSQKATRNLCFKGKPTGKQQFWWRGP